MKTILAFSAGGHYTEINQIRDIFEKNCVNVTTYREDTKNIKNAYFIKDFKRNPFKFLVNLFQSAKIILKERPDLLVTTGAGLVIPICYVAKLMGAKIIYIESFCRVKDPSLAGKAIYPIADLFLVQWKDLLSKYGFKAKYGGRVF